MFHRYLKCGKVEINKTECRNGCRNMCIKVNKRNKRYKRNKSNKVVGVKMDVGKNGPDMGPKQFGTEQ